MGKLTRSYGNAVLDLVHCDVAGNPVHVEKFIKPFQE
jgi:hypothetical protein